MRLNLYRLRGALDYARPGRLSYPFGFRWKLRARVRAAAAGRKLRRNRARGRRHCLDGRRDARGVQRGLPRCRYAAAARRPDRRGRDDGRDQSGYGLNTETEDATAVSRPLGGPQPAGQHPNGVPRACTAAGSRWRQGSIHRSGLPGDVAGGGAGLGTRRCCRCLHGKASLFRKDQTARALCGEGAWTSGQIACGSVVEPRRSSTCFGIFCFVRRSSGAHGRGRRRGHGARQHGGRVLPGAFYFIRETMKPPVELVRAHGVNMALATDCNPGSSPLTSLLLAMNMGATLFRMTVAECLAAVTREGARALGVLGEPDARSRQILRSRDLGRRPACRADLPDGLQPAAPPGCGGDNERPGRTHRRSPVGPRLDLAQVLAGAAVWARFMFWPRVEAASVIVAQAAGGQAPVYGINTGFENGCLNVFRRIRRHCRSAT